MNPNTTPKHRAEQSTPTRPQPTDGKHRRSRGLTLSDRLAKREAAGELL